MKLKIISLLMSLCILLCSCSMKQKNNENYNSSNFSYDEIKAVWISYSELKDIINSSKDTEELRKNIAEVVKNCKSFRLNRIVLHVRAFSDAYYMSDVFPLAECLKGKIKNNKDFDPLKLFCELAHENGIFLDAWVNPYRISYNNDIKLLEENDYFKKSLSKDIKNNDLSVTQEGVFYNPASVKVQKKVLNGIREILENYNVDGIHIDDYFYPTASKDFDSVTYKKYKNSGGTLELDDWRRENVSTLVSQIYSLVKTYDDSKLFTISPSADIKADFNELYADVELWCSQSGYADYIIPQIYFGFKHSRMPFEGVASQWAEITDKKYVGLCFGLACYKCSQEDEYAGDGIDEWQKNNDIISKQISLVRKLDNYGGVFLYSYSSLFGVENAEKCKTELQNIKNVL